MRHGIRCQNRYQGLIAVLTKPRPSRLDPSSSPVLYVDYLEAAPWNLKDMTATPRFLGVGTRLIVEAVLLSREAGLSGRIGLHALPQAEDFYQTRCGMTRLGPDESYYDLPYFEYTELQAIQKLHSLKLD